jgi:hypothetical protein
VTLFAIGNILREAFAETGNGYKILNPLNGGGRSYLFEQVRGKKTSIERKRSAPRDICVSDGLQMEVKYIPPHWLCLVNRISDPCLPELT